MTSYSHIIILLVKFIGYVNGDVLKISCWKGIIFLLYFDNYSLLDILYKFERNIMGQFLKKIVALSS